MEELFENIERERDTKYFEFLKKKHDFSKNAEMKMQQNYFCRKYRKYLIEKDSYSTKFLLIPKISNS
jgi:hypothetical protein